MGWGFSGGGLTISVNFRFNKLLSIKIVLNISHCMKILKFGLHNMPKRSPIGDFDIPAWHIIYVADFSANSYCNSRLTLTSGTMSARRGTGHCNGLMETRLKGGPQCPVLQRWSLSHLITDSRQPRHSLGDTRRLTNTISVRSPARGL